MGKESGRESRRFRRLVAGTRRCSVQQVGAESILEPYEVIQVVVSH